MRIGVLMNRMPRPFLNPVNQFNLTIHIHSKEEVISPCQGRYGKYLKIYSRKFHVGVLASTWDLRHFVMPQILLKHGTPYASRSRCFIRAGKRKSALCCAWEGDRRKCSLLILFYSAA